MNPHRISFARTLPILAFLLSYVIIAVSRAHVLHSSFEGSASLTSLTVRAANFQGGLINFAVYKLAGSNSGMLAPEWKAMAFPIYCLPFWWLAGLGLDALFRQRQIRWWAFLAGSLLWALHLFLVVGIALYVLVAQDRYPIALECGIGLWFLLLSAFPIAWLKQALERRRTKRILHARLSAESQ